MPTKRPVVTHFPGVLAGLIASHFSPELGELIRLISKFLEQ